ncbi:gamma carbonic anhydrase family protein [Vibrio sp. 10N.286.49.C2]|uniref:gamma carbonic anhydrase family protein n=1 Tax=unclassified Vibrio TaxID=2614977 RepID=UPI000C855C72|nr:MULTISPECIES: gamma carbonic anhydrase family protein [unclassified Vibrio]PMH36535.1 gamma carbonic anhydrase family protein [Vibrio sp. 10N.286.49.C2]PMH52440.1 gamma carbonic anhydrase family protein [Vibrio sp. 10N.286.49.B1]PMH83536.1 gamma carbonic anhydrase family protein [Vibrio sp. 10N.286.48.B7]
MTSVRSFRGICPQFDSSVYIDATSTIIGNVHLGKDVSIWPFVSARGDVNKIVIGDRTNIQDNSVLHVTHKNTDNPDGYPLLIGNDVTIGHQVMLHGCSIHDRVLVGMGSIILDGSIIESDVMIGAGSLVPPNKTLESGYLYMGSPVKKIRLLTEKEQAFLQKSSDNYVQNKNDYINTVEIIR